ncbi:hypothetical protein ACF3N7_08625 [Cruoricaptor ignavus]|uniref:hypothetical protein n=1 Tax=Cruoricaptor ignavus TaxID=1118202 RepID=UPI00370D5524
MKKLIATLAFVLAMGMTSAQQTHPHHPHPTKHHREKPAKDELPTPPHHRHLKKDGTPDKRYKENKKLKKDGTPDRRYKENK